MRFSAVARAYCLKLLPFRPHAIFRQSFRQVVARGLIGVALIFIGSGPAVSQSSAIMKRGDAAVTSFSGTKTNADVPKGVHPLDETFIDQGSPSLRIFDLSDLGGPPAGQTVDVTKSLSVAAKEIGQVFGIALDNPDDGVAPNIFAAATSLYGLQIVAKRDGKPVRLVTGEPGARWMAGQFGTRNGGGPGTIWKIDGKTGAVSMFATIKSGPNDNAGPGLGALAYDFVTRQIYVPNLETGYIHHVGTDGKDLGIFDHGTSGRTKSELEPVAYDSSKYMSIENSSFSVEKPDTWGYTDKRRLVIAVAVRDERLFYSVADGPQVWSVGLDSEGGFVDDARLEVDLSDAPEPGMITGIVFDSAGEMYLTQRGELKGSYDFRTFARPDKSMVVHYSWNKEDDNWSLDSEEFSVGLKSPHRATNGGVALGYGYDDNGAINTKSCNATLWTTGDHLGDDAGGEIVSGLHGISKSAGQLRPTYQPKSGSSALQGGLRGNDLTELTPPTDSWLIDLDGKSKANDAYGVGGGLVIHSELCDPADSDPSTRPEPIDVPLPDPQIGWPDFGPDDLDPGDFPPWGLPPVGMPGLDIIKLCAPAAFGGMIKCTITVENTGTWPFLFPITVSDATTITAGPGAGGAMNISSVVPDGGEWTCTPTPTMNLTCALPPEHLLPGVTRSFVVDIDTSTMIADGNVGFTNCASLGAPYWGIACDHAGSDITVKKTANPGCIAGAACTFNFEFTNNSPSPFNGQVQLTDEMFKGVVGPLNAPAVGIAGDFGCAGGNPAGIPFSCLSTMVLAAGETRSVAMTVTMPAPSPDYWARNCIAVTGPGVAPGDLSGAMPPGGGSLGTGGALSCAWMAVGVPAAHANLKMQKTAQACGKLPGDENSVKCDYTISITNTGPSDFNNPITFDETVDPAATMTLNDPAWACGGGAPTYTCTSIGIATVAANETISIPVSVTTPKNVVEANTCYVPNTVTLTVPPFNIATNYLAADDTASADGDAFLLEFDADGAAIILCDPTNLKTTKVAKGPCEKVGAGWSCEYRVEVENTGPDPYKGRLEVIDVMSVAPTSVSISGTAGWSRIPAVGHDVYSLPKRTLQKGDHVTLDLTVVVPDGELCSVTNTAHMTFPVMKRHNGDPTDDTAVATAKVPRPECRRPPVCKPKDGEIRTSSGACACEPGATRGKDGMCVSTPDEPEEPKTPDPDPEPERPDPPTKTCPDGYPVPRNGVCPCGPDEIWSTTAKKCINDDYDPPGDTILPDPGGPVVPLCRLLPGQIRTSENRCVCPGGRSWNSKTYCAPKPCRRLRGQIRTKDNRCVCENGRNWNSETYCERRKPSCTPRAGEVIIRGECKCSNGRTWSSKTHCEKPPKVCSNGDLYLAAPGVCCLIGQVYRDGKCTRPTPTCGRPRFKDKNGNCTCGRNKRYISRNNTCVSTADPAKDCKDKGWTWITGRGCFKPDGNTCKRPRFKDKKGNCTCGTNKRYIQRYNTCVGTSNPAKDCKNKGWTWITGRGCFKPEENTCKRPRYKNSRGKCTCGPNKVWNSIDHSCDRKVPSCARPRYKTKSGTCTCGPNKTYISRNNTCVSKNNPAKDCKSKGWNWISGRGCFKPVSKKTKCINKGWNWSHGTCSRPLSAAQKCKKKGWTWKNSRCHRPASAKSKCLTKGWRWKGFLCLPPKKASGNSTARKKRACLAKGWRWNGKECKSPSIYKAPAPKTKYKIYKAVPKRSIPR